MEVHEQTRFHERIATLESKSCQYDSCIQEIKNDIKQIKEKLLGRPSWAVMTIITCLTSLTGILLTCLVTGIKLSL